MQHEKNKHHTNRYYYYDCCRRRCDVVRQLLLATLQVHCGKLTFSANVPLGLRWLINEELKQLYELGYSAVPAYLLQMSEDFIPFSVLL